MTRIEEKTEDAEKWGWRRGHRIGIAILLCVMLGVLAFWLWKWPGGRGEVVVVKGEAVDLPVSMDPNVADAGALSRVPGIGEKMAAAIVKYREDNKGNFADGIVYRKFDDLVSAVGIKNKKTQELCRSYLVFVDEPAVSPHGLKAPGKVGEADGEDLEE